MVLWRRWPKRLPTQNASPQKRAIGCASRRMRSRSRTRSFASLGISRTRVTKPRISCRRRTRVRSGAGARSQPGTNLRAWLLRILTNLNIDRGRRSQRAPQTQPLEANDYYLYDKLADADDGASDEERVVERLSQDDIVSALSGGSARLPRRDRARRHRRLQLPGRGADSRHPDRHGDVASAPGSAHPEARACRVRPGGCLMNDVQQDPCAHCEEMMQPYLDHILTEAERVEAESHLDDCEWCRRRYRFEESLRVYVRQIVDRADADRAQAEARRAADPARTNCQARAAGRRSRRSVSGRCRPGVAGSARRAASRAVCTRARRPAGSTPRSAGS